MLTMTFKEPQEKLSGEIMSYKRAVITEELIDLTEDTLTALILKQCIYWSTKTKDTSEYLKEIRKHKPHTATHQECEDDVYDSIESLCNNGWFYKKADELKDELMVKDSINTIRRRMRTLKDKGYIEERNNPYNPWDKVLQYRVNLVQIEWDLREIGHTLATIMGKDYPIVKDAIAEALGDNNQERETNHSTGENEETDAVADNSRKRSPEETADKPSSEKSSITRYQETGKQRQERLRREKQEHEERKFDNLPDDNEQNLTEQEQVETKETEVVNPYPEPERHDHRINKHEESAMTSAQSANYAHNDKDLYLEHHEETLFFQLARGWKVSQDKTMDESRAGAIIQAMIDRIQSGKSKAQDRMLLMMFRNGQLNKYADKEMQEEERWQRIWEDIERREQKQKS